MTVFLSFQCIREKQSPESRDVVRGFVSGGVFVTARRNGLGRLSVLAPAHGHAEFDQ